MPTHDRMPQKAPAPLDEAIKLAVRYCIDNNILKEYLEQNSPEVINMLTGEFNLNDYKKVLREETIEEVREEFMKEFMKKGMKEGMKEGEKKVNYILKLMEQGLSYEEIKKKIKKRR